MTLSNAEQGLQRAVTSTDTGAYEFVSLPPGTYAIRVEATGFRAYDQRNIQLLVNNPTTLNITMLVGSSSETVEVSAQSQTINTTDASLGVAFGENQVKQLPLESRNVGELLSLQAGVVYTGNNPAITQGMKDTDTRSGAVNGARSDQSNVMLDGSAGEPEGRVCVSIGAAGDAGFGGRVPRDDEQCGSGCRKCGRRASGAGDQERIEHDSWIGRTNTTATHS